ncbi:MAG: 30S ribosome-binding factor RbfA [Actinomycetota bacterium]
MARQKSPRMRKVNELVREVVADAVMDLKDPRIGFLTITGTETSPDLRHAVVYYSVLGSEEEKSDTAAALKSAKSRIQRAVGSETRLRYTPVLEFKVDPAIDEGLRISQILADIDEQDGDEQDD